MQESNSCCPSGSPESQVDQRHSAPTPHIRHAPWRLDTSTPAPQILAPSPSRSRTWRPLRSGVLTPERDAARAAPRPESHLQRPVDRLHQSNQNVCVPGSPHHYKSTPLYHPKYGLGAAYEAFIHIDQKPVWKVCFPNAPGGTQDCEVVRQPEMERCLMAFKAQLSSASKVNDPHQLTNTLVAY
jgi:hypothetical protein